MSSGARKVINAWIRDFVPKNMPFGEVEKLAKAAKISSGTIRQLRNRESVSADTIVSIMLARGVSENDLMNLPQNDVAKYSKTLSEWNHLGNTLSDKQREQIIRLAAFLLSEWKIK